MFSGNASARKNQPKLISHSDIETVITFTVDSYELEDVLTPNGVEVVVNAAHSGRIMKKGAPDLVRLSSSLIIPDKGKMKVEVIDSQFIELSNIKVAPSKGNILRNVDPVQVPYEYGKEYKKNAFSPGNLVELNKPYIARDFRGQTVLLYPFQYNPVTAVLRVYTEITVKVEQKGGAGKNEFNRNKPLKFEELNSEFQQVYSRHFINFDVMSRLEASEASLQYTPLSDPRGRMLIVCYNGFLSNMSDFVSYKQSIGYTVDLVDYSTIGSASALKTYVSNYYNTNGLTYLLLVGDHAQVPVSSTSAGDSDNNYGYIVGSDHYQDIFVGRFSATTTAHVDTQVNRTIYYERDLPSSATWFRQATGMGSSEGPGHNNEYDYQHINNILTDLANDGYTTSTNHQSGGSTSNLSNLINAGKGTLWYCGHGYYDRWSCGWSFTNSNVAALTNDNMLPAVFSVACQVGNFKNYTCFCEYWLRETNGSNPTGAIAHCGSTINQSWSPPMDAQDEMCDLLVSTAGPNRTLGGVFVNGLFKMNDLNGTAGYNMTDTWVCFGDPSVQLRTPASPDSPYNCKADYGSNTVFDHASGNTYNPAKSKVYVPKGLNIYTARLTGEGHNHDKEYYARVMRVNVNGNIYKVISWLNWNETKSFSYTLPSGILVNGMNDIQAYIHWGNDYYDNGHWVSVDLELDTKVVNVSGYGTTTIFSNERGNTYNKAYATVNIPTSMTVANGKVTISGWGKNQDTDGYVRTMRVKINGTTLVVDSRIPDGSTDSFSKVLNPALFHTGANDVYAYIHWGDDRYDDGHRLELKVTITQ
jgi:hypothetical protein